MQLPVVMDTIEALIQARPSSTASATRTSALAAPTSALATPTSLRGNGQSASTSNLAAAEGREDEVEVRKAHSLTRAARSAKWNSRQLSIRRSEH